MFKTTLPILLLAALIPDVCEAYLDPGSSYLLWQVVVASFMAAALMWKRVYGWVSRVFRR